MNNWQDRKEGTLHQDQNVGYPELQRASWTSQAEQEGKVLQTGARKKEPKGLALVASLTQRHQLVSYLDSQTCAFTFREHGWSFIPSKHSLLPSENTDGPHHPENMDNLHILGEL